MSLLTEKQISTIERLALSTAERKFVKGGRPIISYFTIEQYGAFWHIRLVVHDKATGVKDNRYFSKRSTKALANRQCNAANLRLAIEEDRAKRKLKSVATLH